MLTLAYQKLTKLNLKSKIFTKNFFFFFKSITEELIKAASLPHIYLFDLRFPLVAIGYHVPSEVSSQARRYRWRSDAIGARNTSRSIPGF